MGPFFTLPWVLWVPAVALVLAKTIAYFLHVILNIVVLLCFVLIIITQYHQNQGL